MSRRGRASLRLLLTTGPYPVTTPLLLDVLDDLHVRATFFLIGRDALDFRISRGALRKRDTKSQITP